MLGILSPIQKKKKSICKLFITLPKSISPLWEASPVTALTNRTQWEWSPRTSESWPSGLRKRLLLHVCNAPFCHPAPRLREAQATWTGRARRCSTGIPTGLPFYSQHQLPATWECQVEYSTHLSPQITKAPATPCGAEDPPS